MKAPNLITGLGEIMQMAYVPQDFDQSLQFWTRTMGAGPFFMLNHVKLDRMTYRGQAVDIDFSLALGYWGEVQIEIIRQHNDAPSIYKAWRDAGHDGVHHVCILVDDMAAARRTCADAGTLIAQDAFVPGGGEVIYVDTGGGPGTMVEILKPAPGGREFFAMMRNAARDWDGKDPLRVLS